MSDLRSFARGLAEAAQLLEAANAEREMKARVRAEEEARLRAPETAAIAAWRRTFDAKVDEADSRFEEIRALPEWQPLVDAWPECSGGVRLPVFLLDTKGWRIFSSEDTCAPTPTSRCRWTIGAELRISLLDRYYGDFPAAVVESIADLRADDLWRGERFPEGTRRVARPARIIAAGAVWLIERVLSGRILDDILTAARTVRR